ncbi:MAG: hypothetical protein E6Q50_16190 [Lysobacter sp.]|nr:MAG: hypothetical protein E6Q50_16190 [Lysobacter sp.]
MKKFRTLTLAAAAIALFSGALASNAASPGACSTCFKKYQACMANGGNYYTCYEQYETCLYYAGCMVP